MKIRPLARRRRDSQYGGRKTIRGKIVAVGKGKILESGQVRSCDVKVDDKILFASEDGWQSEACLCVGSNRALGSSLVSLH